jgi:hypothetical protein
MHSAGINIALFRELKFEIPKFHIRKYSSFDFFPILRKWETILR